MTSTKIPVAAADMSGDEEQYVVEAIRSSWVSSKGPFVDRFERTFAEICGTAACVSVCNGTVALHLALLALDVRPGDEVLVPARTRSGCLRIGTFEPVSRTAIGGFGSPPLKAQ
jgi:perosamine synthetase